MVLSMTSESSRVHVLNEDAKIQDVPDSFLYRNTDMH